MTRISDLPIGAKVVDPNTKYGGRTITWIIADINHKGYPENTVTLISEKVLVERRFDASSSNYKNSEIRKWLNDTNGLMKDFSNDFKASIIKTNIPADPSESMYDKIFLASYSELEYDEESSTKGYRLPVFLHEDYDSRICVDFNNQPREWWLRSRWEDGDLVEAHSILYNGFPSGIPYTNGGWVRPLCNVSNDIYVLNTSNSSNEYIIANWHAPLIIESTTSTDMGLKDKEFSFTYKVVDENVGQTITVEEYVDNTKIKQFSAKSGSTYTFNISKLNFIKLLNGENIVKIVAKDDKSGSANKIFSFIKNVTNISFELSQPLEADAMVTKATINLVGSIPVSAILKVEMCNNAYDANPTWEDVTIKAIKERKIFFANKQKTASKWGVNVRVSMDRNGATEECYISSIGGSYE